MTQPDRAHTRPSPHDLASVSPVSAPTSDLYSEAEGVLHDVSESMRAVLSPLFDETAGPTDLKRVLGLHKTLAWRVLQVAYARDVLAAAQHIPGAEGIEIFLRAASRQRVSKDLLDGVRNAVTRYRALVKAHAGDRASMDVMLQSISESSESDVELKAARRAGYRSASYAWGVQTAVRVLAAIYTPVGDDLMDVATVRAHVRMRRVRKDGVLRLSRTIEHDTDAPGPRRAVAQPIEPEGVFGGVPLMQEFCTRPLPAMAAAEVSDRAMEYRFTDQRIGEQSAVTVFIGDIRSGLRGARWRTPDNTSNLLMLNVRDPIGLVVLDFWAPVGTFTEHQAIVVGAVGVDPQQQRPVHWHVLPASTNVERMGRGLQAARIDEVPEYERAIARSFDRLGWRPNGYELHRLRLEYPVLGSCLIHQAGLPER
jgi:hypothetical protein